MTSRGKDATQGNGGMEEPEGVEMDEREERLVYRKKAEAREERLVMGEADQGDERSRR